MALIKYMMEHGASLHAKGEEGRTSLHYVVVSGVPDALTFLIGQGFPIDATDQKGLTALGVLCDQEDPSIGSAELLLSMGANPNVLTKAGFSPLHLHMLKHKISEPLVMKLLDCGADPYLGPDSHPVPFMRNALSTAMMMAASARAGGEGGGIVGMLFDCVRSKNPNDPVLTAHERLVPILQQGKRTPKTVKRST